MGRLKRPRAAIAAAVTATALIAAGTVPVIGAQAAAAGKADSGTSYAGDDVQCGGDLCVAGYTFDKLFGTTAVTYKIKVGTGNKPGTLAVTANPVIMFTSTGELKGNATATLTTGSNGQVTISAGKLNLTTGTGGRVGHTWVGTFTGNGSTKTGFYKFVYRGTYK